MHIIVPILETVKHFIPIFDTIDCNMNIFTDKLRVLLEQSGKMQKDICIELGISKQKMSKWKTGYNEPSLDELIVIADYFCVSVDYLLGKEDEFGERIRMVSFDITDANCELFSNKEVPPEQKERANNQNELFSTLKKLNNTNLTKLLGFSKGLLESQIEN